MKSIFPTAALLSAVFLLSACDSGGGNATTGSSEQAPATSSTGNQSTSGSQPAIETITGTFVDATVEGLQYRGPTFTGRTNAQGNFRCLPKEEVEFYLGNIVVGRALCGKVITPVDLIRNAESADDKRVVRIAVFLQSVNTGDDKERIVISPEAYVRAQSAPATKLDVNSPDEELDIYRVLREDLNIPEEKQVPESEALGHLLSNLNNSEVVGEDYCEVLTDFSDPAKPNYHFSRPANRCEHRRQRYALVHTALPQLQMYAEMAKKQLWDNQDNIEAMEAVASKVTEAKQAWGRINEIKSFVKSGRITPAQASSMARDYMDSQVGALKDMIGNEYADIWIDAGMNLVACTQRAYSDCISGLQSQAEESIKLFLKAAVAAQDTAKINNNNLAAQVLIEYYNRFADEHLLAQALGVSSNPFSWDDAIKEIGRRNNQKEGLFQFFDDYDLATVKDLVLTFIDVVENASKPLELPEQESEKLHYPLGNNTARVVFVDENGSSIRVPGDAYVRIVARRFADADNWGVQISCKISPDGQFEHSCYIYTSHKEQQDAALSDPNEQYQVVVFRNHVNPDREAWEGNEDLYKWVGERESGWSYIEVKPEDYRNISTGGW